VFSRLILSTNHAAAHIDRLTLTEPPTPAAAEAQAD